MISLLFQLFFQLFVASVRLGLMLAGLVIMLVLALLRVLWRALRRVDWPRVRTASFTGTGASGAPQASPPKRAGTGMGLFARLRAAAPAPSDAPPVAPTTAAPPKLRGPQPLRPPPWANR